jgi:hypothetical protein
MVHQFFSGGTAAPGCQQNETAGGNCNGRSQFGSSNAARLQAQHRVTTVVRPWFKRGISNLARTCDPHPIRGREKENPRAAKSTAS